MDVPAETGPRCFEVARKDPALTRMVAAEPGLPRDGEALFEVERFGLSANNVTYAALGETLRYWDLFPAEPGWGRIPVWGYLRVRASRVPGVEPGRRAFGLCPMADRVMLRPGHLGPATFAETSPHRSGLASAYNVYAWADTDPPSLADEAAPGAGDALVVLLPVFWLSFTLDDYLSRPGLRDQPVIVTSASSKAALGLAHLLSRRGVPVTGLTSAGHQPWVAGLSVYGTVLPYDQVEALPATRAVLVDLAGNPALRDQIRRRVGRLARVIVAGYTHSCGPRAADFFVPDVIRALAREQGWPALERRFQAALGDFARFGASWLEVVRHRGLDAAAAVYQSVLANAVRSPAEAHLIDVTTRS